MAQSLTDAETLTLLYDWRRWARPCQKVPDGDWDGWLILAGRGWGKTRTGAETIRDWVESGTCRRIGLVSETAADGRDILAEGESGILSVCPPWNKPIYESSKRRITWPNGAIATLYDAREPDQLRGPQHDAILFDELAKYHYAEAVFDNAMFGLRLGDHLRFVITTTPRPVALIKRLVGEDGVFVTRGRSDDNLSNLSPTYRRNVIDRYRGTRLGRQELDAEILDDVPGALWSRRMVDEHRVAKAPAMQRIVVAVDPAVSSGPDSDEHGIVVTGIAPDTNGCMRGYVMDDWSCHGSPDAWARKVVGAYRLHEADCIVAEANQGGDMVESIIRSVAPDVPVKLVYATRGKFIRAAPVSALYEQGRIHHVGTHAVLEDQMFAFTADEMSETSPDRVDALVWGLTELFPALTAPPTERKPRAPSPGGWMA
jgi:phage terminase large subunit-like protein